MDPRVWLDMGINGYGLQVIGDSFWFVFKFYYHGQVSTKKKFNTNLDFDLQQVFSIWKGNGG
jgi:hypothetical protein